MLCDMNGSWLRRTLASILGLVFAVGMTLSLAQATPIGTKITTASATSGATRTSKCPDCDHSNRDTKATDCRLAVCGGPGVATLASMPVLAVRTDRLAFALPTESSLMGWAHRPDPYPPRRPAFS